jgi:hypothetical protein
MALVKCIARWDGRKARERGLRRGELLLDVDPRYHRNMHKAFEHLHVKQRDRLKVGEGTYEMYDIEVTLDILYRRRTLDQNALMWSLYEIEAAELNAGSPDPLHETTAGRLYAQDMEVGAPTVTLVLQAKLLPDLASLGMSWRRATPVESTDLVTVEIIRTSSKWTTVEMARHINMLFNRLAMRGVHLEKAADIGHFWVQFREHVNDQHIALTDAKVSKAEYREANTLCEGCGEYIGPTMENPHGSGHIHHIKSKGAGGAEPDKDWPANWLHLCPKCHDVWNQPEGGVEAFIKIAPHCKNKIKEALNEAAGDSAASSDVAEGAAGGAEEKGERIPGDDPQGYLPL